MLDNEDLEKLESAFGGGWNYRVVKRKNEQGDMEYFLAEAYYSSEGGHVVTAITPGPMFPYGETPDELRADFKLMRLAFRRRVLDYETRQELDFYP